MSKEGIGLPETGQPHMERLYVGRPQGSPLRHCASLICERDVDEEDVVRRWWALPAGCILPLSNGDAYQVVFAGVRVVLYGMLRGAHITNIAPGLWQAGTQSCAHRYIDL
jgi:hypothetical protein